MHLPSRDKVHISVCEEVLKFIILDDKRLQTKISKFSCSYYFEISELSGNPQLQPKIVAPEKLKFSAATGNSSHNVILNKNLNFIYILRQKRNLSLSNAK